jgi:hypothetical protein
MPKRTALGVLTCCACLTGSCALMVTLDPRNVQGVWEGWGVANNALFFEEENCVAPSNTYPLESQF